MGTSPWIRRLASAWPEVPGSAAGLEFVADILALDDARLGEWWLRTRDVMFGSDDLRSYRWIVDVYRDYLKGRRVIDVGPGTGIHGITFAEEGAEVCFVDVVEQNLRLIERICRLRDVRNVSFMRIENLEDPAQLPADFDAIVAYGSLHHAPAFVLKAEFEALASRLKVGGRWLMAAYPIERWERDGGPPFEEWGRITDGGRSPWAEWYDDEKLLKQLQPCAFKPLMSFNHPNNDFNWFDFVRVA